MTKITKLIIFAVVFAVVVALGSLSVNYLYAAWQGPSSGPADPNVAAPIHTGGPQIKDGALTVTNGLISNLFRSVSYGDSKLSLTSNDVVLSSADYLDIKADDNIDIDSDDGDGGRIQLKEYGNEEKVRVDDSLCLNSWTNCISDWSEIAGIQSCEDLSCGVESCSDCSYDSKYVNRTTDSMTGDLSVGGKIVSNSLNVTGEIVSNSATIHGNTSISNDVSIGGDVIIGTEYMPKALTASNIYSSAFWEDSRPVRTEYRIVNAYGESSDYLVASCADNEIVVGGGCECYGQEPGGCGWNPCPPPHGADLCWTCEVGEVSTIGGSYPRSIRSWACKCTASAWVHTSAICAK